MEATTQRGRSELGERLRARKTEIVQRALTRIYAISDPAEVADPTYGESLRGAVSAALDYGLAAIDTSAHRIPPVPVALLAQARLAARNKISLDTVLRRYFAGYALLGDFLVEEAQEGLWDAVVLKAVLRDQAGLLDRLIAAVSDEYAREAQSRSSGTEQRRARCAKQLLAGELLDASELDWNFEDFHLALVGNGPGASVALRRLSSSSRDFRLLLVRSEEGTVWAWLGAGRKLDSAELAAGLRATGPAGCAFALGESSRGLVGWRLSHRQAVAALPIASRGSERVVRYAEVALLASVLRDELLAASLRQLYLEPLRAERGGGKAARETLRAYLGAERNISSTAAVLGVNRHTVASRLRTIEERLGSSLDSCGAELEMALRLEELSDPASLEISPVAA